MTQSIIRGLDNEDKNVCTAFLSFAFFRSYLLFVLRVVLLFFFFFFFLPLFFFFFFLKGRQNMFDDSETFHGTISACNVQGLFRLSSAAKVFGGSCSTGLGPEGRVDRDDSQ
jgi:hypothetical protein